MAGRQLPAAIEEFASYLRALTRRIDPDKGWYAVFAQRDPDGLRACLDGQEIPPWDVVQALLQDLSAQRGAQTANVAAARAAALYRASITAHDAAPGTREALRARLAAMQRERFAAADRERDLHAAKRAGAGTTPDGDPVDAALAWAQDDHYRATARCEELTARLAALPAAPGEPAPPGAPGAPSPWGGGGGPQVAPGGGPAGRPQPGGARPAPAGAGSAGVPSATAQWSAAGPGGPQGAPGAGPAGRPQPGGARPAPAGAGAPPGAPGAQMPGAPPGPGGGSSAAAGEDEPAGAPPGTERASWVAGGLQDPSIAGLGGRTQPDDGPSAPPRPRGARFAAAYDGAPDPAPVPPAEQTAPPRGARFAGAGQQAPAPRGARFPGVRGGARKREREAEER
ncbi:collagen alpha-1(III) chain, partial [Streptomyces himastatinicus ATCC 53653]